MKHTTLLLALCVCFGLTAFAQQANVTTTNAKRITITTTKTDDNGKQITETWIAEGDEPSEILKEMAIDPEAIKTVVVTGEPVETKGERLFLFRSADDNTTIEGTLNENNDDQEIVKEVIIIRNDGNEEIREVEVHTQPLMYRTVRTNDRKANCAAMGVYINSSGQQKGAVVNQLIEQGGAKDAGLLAGDIITKIEEFDIQDYNAVHFAMSHFSPGDQVQVHYNREGKAMQTEVLLKAWNAIPGHEAKYRTECTPEATAPIDVVDTDVDDPASLPSLKPLELQDVRMYPNPTKGDLDVAFTTDPGPLSVTITDVNGKIVFRDEMSSASGSYNRRIDIKSVPQGNYVLTVSQGDRVYSQQIAKQ